MVMNKIGITERGDAGIHLDWVNAIDYVKFAVLITKNVTPTFINQALKYKDKIIIHLTCTGYGGTPIEPNVPAPVLYHQNVLNLIKAGFPKEQLVLRVDPVTPTDKGIDTACNVLNMFMDTGITRVRFSYLQIYKHVKERFKKRGVQLPYTSFYPPEYMRRKFEIILQDYVGVYDISSCASSNFDTPCISQQDADILGVKDIDFTCNHKQRKRCGCPDIKVDMLAYPMQCIHKCLYCYWKTDYKNLNGGMMR